jgi:hypothetical protein
VDPNAQRSAVTADASDSTEAEDRIVETSDSDTTVIEHDEHAGNTAEIPNVCTGEPTKSWLAGGSQWFGPGVASCDRLQVGMYGHLQENVQMRHVYIRTGPISRWEVHSVMRRALSVVCIGPNSRREQPNWTVFLVNAVLDWHLLDKEDRMNFLM